MAKKRAKYGCCFFALRGPISTLFCKSLLYMPKDTILENLKISLSKKVQRTEKNWVFGSWRAEFAKIWKRLRNSLILPQRGCIPNIRKSLANQAEISYISYGDFVPKKKVLIQGHREGGPRGKKHMFFS